MLIDRVARHAGRNREGRHGVNAPAQQNMAPLKLSTPLAEPTAASVGPRAASAKPDAAPVQPDVAPPMDLPIPLQCFNFLLAVRFLPPQLVGKFTCRNPCAGLCFNINAELIFQHLAQAVGASWASFLTG